MQVQLLNAETIRFPVSLHLLGVQIVLVQAGSPSTSKRLVLLNLKFIQNLIIRFCNRLVYIKFC